MEIDTFISKHMGKGKKPTVPARLQTALALLERVRAYPCLRLDDHLAARGSSGLESHETWGEKAHSRWQITEAINKNHGRRSSSLGDWGQLLLNQLKRDGFQRATEQERAALIDRAQRPFAAILRRILEQDPIRVRLKGRTPVAVIREVLDQADTKGKAADVAQYLVGAKLMLRLGVEVPVHPANRGDRRGRGDQEARLGDFEIADAIIEVAIGLPDDKHLTQIGTVLEETDKEIWLITRDARVKTWQDELEEADEFDMRRVVVSSVEGFVGQNMAELGKFSSRECLTQLVELFQLYNSRWVSALGPSGIRVETLK
jgi:hypothetical protein